MAKRSHKIGFKGRLDARTETITETIKISKEETADIKFDLGGMFRDMLREFHGTTVSFSISAASDAVEEMEAPEVNNRAHSN